VFDGVAVVGQLLVPVLGSAEATSDVWLFS
jgi:hypothetical protein